MAKMWRYERAVARHAALQIVCGPDDETFLRKYVTRKQPIEVIANGLKDFEEISVVGFFADN